MSIWVGIWMTCFTCWPGISTSEKPTADADTGGAVLSVVPSMVTRSVWKVWVGKVSVWPDVAWEDLFKAKVTGSFPSKVSVTLDTQRARSPRCGCTRVMWLVVTGLANCDCHHWPLGSGTKVPVIQAVSKLSSIAL